MELKSNLQALRYVRKMLAGEYDGILPFSVRVQKPVPKGGAGVPLPRSAPGREGVPEALLTRFLREADAARGCRIQTCLVVRHGRVILDASWAPYSTARWHVTHSLCKSFTGTAIGLLAQEGALSLDETVCDIFPDQCSLLTGRRMRAVTVRHLLTMTSGVNFKEAGAVCSANWARSFLESSVLFEPGERFDYNSMNSYMLAAIVRRRAGQGLTDYLRPRLFEPLGFGPVAWQKSPQGTDKGGWGMYVRLEDAAKLGLLYLHDGVWRTQRGPVRILDKAWTDAARAPHAVSRSGEEYGYQMWPDTKAGVCMFNGMFGQYVILAPDLDLVVAINAGADHLFTRGALYTAALRLIQALRAGEKPLAVPGELPRTLRSLHRTQDAALPALPALCRPLQPMLAAAGQARAAALLAGRRFSFDANAASLLPIMTGCMNDCYPAGLRELAFEKTPRGGLCLVWRCARAEQRVPLGFARPAPFVLNEGGNRFLAAASAALASDEDGRAVLKITVYLTEESSVRRLKLFLPRAGEQSVRLCLSETPSLAQAARSLLQGSALEQQAEGLLRDGEYLRWRAQRFSSPVFTGREIRPAKAP